MFHYYQSVVSYKLNKLNSQNINLKLNVKYGHRQGEKYL